MNTNAHLDAHLDALDALVDARPMLDPNNYGPGPYYRADQRANMRDRADYWLLRRIAGTPTADEVIEAARGSRLSFVANDDGTVRVDYCAGQYYPREYRAACVRLLARCWWARAAQVRVTPEGTRDYARKMFGRGVARRWFN